MCWVFRCLLFFFFPFFFFMIELFRFLHPFREQTRHTSHRNRVSLTLEKQTVTARWRSNVRSLSLHVNSDLPPSPLSLGRYSIDFTFFSFFFQRAFAPSLEAIESLLIASSPMFLNSDLLSIYSRSNRPVMIQFPLQAFGTNNA